MVLFRVGLQQASSISDMWLKGRKCSEWHFSPTSAKGNVGWAPSYNPCGGKFLHESDRHCHLPQMAKHLKGFQLQDRPAPPRPPLLLIGSGIICWGRVVRFLYKIGRLSKILKMRICFPCGGKFCPKVIPLGAFWQYSGTKRNTREPFHKHKVGLLGTNVHHVGCRGKKKRYFSSPLCLLDDLFILFCF